MLSTMYFAVVLYTPMDTRMLLHAAYDSRCRMEKVMIRRRCRMEKVMIRRRCGMEKVMIRRRCGMEKVMIRTVNTDVVVIALSNFA